MKQDSYVVYCDSQSAIHLTKNSTYHSKSKHFDASYQIVKIHTTENGLDIMTNHYPRRSLKAVAESGLGGAPHMI